MRFQWDDEKAKGNIQNHGVSFQQAALAFDDPDAIRGEDDSHSKDEQRFWLIGLTPKKNLLLVVYTERDGDSIRIISAWKANKEERELYESARS